MAEKPHRGVMPGGQNDNLSRSRLRLTIEHKLSGMVLMTRRFERNYAAILTCNHYKSHFVAFMVSVGASATWDTMKWMGSNSQRKMIMDLYH